MTHIFNSALSTESFAVKLQEITTTSLLTLNTHFQRYKDNDAWDEEKIAARGRQPLCLRAEDLADAEVMLNHGLPIKI